MADSLERCLTLGFPPKNIICMQGPFSRELNVALLPAVSHSDPGDQGHRGVRRLPGKGGGCPGGGLRPAGGGAPRRETGLTLEEIQKKLMEEENA